MIIAIFTVVDKTMGAALVRGAISACAVKCNADVPLLTPMH